MFRTLLAILVGSVATSASPTLCKLMQAKDVMNEAVDILCANHSVDCKTLLSNTWETLLKEECPIIEQVGNPALSPVDLFCKIMTIEMVEKRLINVVCNQQKVVGLDACKENLKKFLDTLTAKCPKNVEAALKEAHGQQDSQKAKSTLESGKYNIEAVCAPGKFLNVDIKGGNDPVHDGSQVVIWDSPHNLESQWILHDLGNNEYNIESVRGPGKYLNVLGRNTDNGTPVVVWSGSTNPETKWNLEYNNDGTYRIGSEVVGYMDKCLNVQGRGTSDDTHVVSWDCNWNPESLWKLTSIARIDEASDVV